MPWPTTSRSKTFDFICVTFSVEPDVRALDHLAPAHDFGRDELVEIRLRHRRMDVESHAAVLGPQIVRSRDSANLLREPLHDRRRSLRGRDNAEPVEYVDVGVAFLLEARCIGQD